MIIVANLRLSWFFAAAGGWVMERAHRQLARSLGGHGHRRAFADDRPDRPAPPPRICPRRAAERPSDADGGHRVLMKAANTRC
jgi:hypothetical protein